jgi:sugar O-acyltransferase (sialic acid O-acetyltransferase NeuD family)
MSDKSKKLVIIGDGEFAMIAYEYFTHDSSYEVSAFAVEKEYLKQTELYNLPVVAFEDLEDQYPQDQYEIFVAITFVKLNRVRARLYNDLKEKGYKFANYISSKAFVWHNVELGENVFIFENNVVQPFCKIGNNVVLWSGNHIGHRTEIADHCFLSSHVVVSGYCKIGESCFVGVNSTFADQIEIGADNFVAMASVISKNFDDNNFIKGNPAEASKVSAKRYFKIRD